MRLNDAVFGGIFIAAGAAVVTVARSFPPVPGQPFGSSLFPVLIGCGFVLVGAGLAVQGILKRRTVPWVVLPEWSRVPRNVWRFLSVIAVLLFYIGAADFLGFILISLIILVVLQRVFGAEWRTTLLSAVLVTVVAEVVFGMLLRVPLPRGILESLIF